MDLNYRAFQRKIEDAKRLKIGAVSIVNCKYLLPFIFHGVADPSN